MSSKAVATAFPVSPNRAERDLPFVMYQPGVTFQLLHADVEVGLWVVRVRFEPGATLQKHKHTGEVFGFTIRGSWKYREYAEVNRAGSYLYEPAGSVHTLEVSKDNVEITDVWFAIRGANLNLDDHGNVESVLDAGAVLEVYRAQCAAAGHTPPNVIGA